MRLNDIKAYIEKLCRFVSDPLTALLMYLIAMAAGIASIEVVSILIGSASQH